MTTIMNPPRKKMKFLDHEGDMYPPTVISWNGSNCNYRGQPDDETLSLYSISTSQTNSTGTRTPVANTAIVPLTDDEEECVSFLMTLKFRKTNVEDDVRKMKQGLKQIQIENREFESTLNNSNFSAPTDKIKNDKIMNERGPDEVGLEDMNTSMPLGLPCDSDILSPLQSYIRFRCVQVFQASRSDCILQPPRLRSRISVGRVGIRCAFCHYSAIRNKSESPDTLDSLQGRSSIRRASQSVSFPSQITGIYSAVNMMQSRHFKVCKEIPDSVRRKMDELKNLARKNRGEGNKRQDYWVQSAKQLGMVDTPDGIRFRASISDWNLDNEQYFDYHQSLKNQEFRHASEHPPPHISNIDVTTLDKVVIPDDATSTQILQDNLSHFMGNSQLFTPQDADLVPPYLFLAMAQMKPCELQKEDKVGCYKDRPLGFRGMCCRHCGGSPGFGKYFPATVRSLAQTTTSQTIIKHVGTKCTKCPESVKTLLLKLQREGLAQGGNYGRGGKDASDGKPKYGSRKIFFHRLWAKIHGHPVPSIPQENICVAKKEEEMSSLGDESASVAKSVTTTEDDTDNDDESVADEEMWESHRFSRRTGAGRKRKSMYRKNMYN